MATSYSSPQHRSCCRSFVLHELEPRPHDYETIHDLKFSPSSSLFATAAADGTVAIYSTRNLLMRCSASRTVTNPHLQFPRFLPSYYQQPSSERNALVQRLYMPRKHARKRRRGGAATNECGSGGGGDDDDEAGNSADDELGERNEVLCISFLSDEIIATGTLDGITRLWQVSDGRLLEEFRAPTSSPVRCIACFRIPNDSNDRIVVARDDHSCQLFARGDSNPLASVVLPEVHDESLAILPSGDWIFAITKTYITMLDSTELTVIMSHPGVMNPSMTQVVSLNENTFLICVERDRIQVGNITGKQRHVFAIYESTGLRIGILKADDILTDQIYFEDSKGPMVLERMIIAADGRVTEARITVDTSRTLLSSSTSFVSRLEHEDSLLIAGARAGPCSKSLVTLISPSDRVFFLDRASYHRRQIQACLNSSLNVEIWRRVWGFLY